LQAERAVEEEGGYWEDCGWWVDKQVDQAELEGPGELHL